jgi:uncharacterized protein
MLETLSEVQTLDLQRDALAVERGEVPADLLAARERHVALRHELGRVQQEHEALRRRVASNELDLKSLQERRKDASESALRASSSKEMAQYQNQELQFATRAQELEEDTLPADGGAGGEGGDGRARGAARLHGARARALEDDERVRVVVAVDGRDADLADRRARLCVEVDAGLLRQYEQVRRARRGLALVGLQDGKRCGGCHVQLPIHVSRRCARASGVTRCPSCGRLLFRRRRRLSLVSSEFAERVDRAPAHVDLQVQVRARSRCPSIRPGRSARPATRSAPPCTRMRLACAYQVSAPPAWRILTRLP